MCFIELIYFIFLEKARIEREREEEEDEKGTSVFISVSIHFICLSCCALCTWQNCVVRVFIHVMDDCLKICISEVSF